MKKLLVMILLFAMVKPAFAVEDGQVLYVGGTATGLKENTMGRFDMTHNDALIFEYDGGKLAIPYGKIEKYEYTEELAHKLGVVATVAVVLVKYRHRRHFYRISYKDDAGVAQVAIFEVSKQMLKTVSAVLDTRAPRPCQPSRYTSCKFVMPVSSAQQDAPKPKEPVTPAPSVPVSDKR